MPQKVTLKNGKSFVLKIAEGFEVIPAVEGLKRVRFFARSPDGRIFVTDMHNLTDNKRGTIYILDKWDPGTGKFGSVTAYLKGLRNPNSVQFYRDPQGQDWIYIAETDKLTRRRFEPGEISPSDTHPQLLAKFPDYGLSYKYGGWHLTRTVAVSPNGKIYVSVGSSCNACIEKEKIRASIIEMNPDGSGQREIASGLRNAVGLKWIGQSLWATNQGSDHLGLQKPDETFYRIWPPSGTGGADTVADYGWPYCHSSNGKIFADPKFKRPGGCSQVIRPNAFFPARSSALGFDFFDDANSPDSIKNAFLVSLHGSTNKAIGHGYKIVVMRNGEGLKNFITGFLQGKTVNGRPCDILKVDPNSFFFTDDHTGVIYYVRKRGWRSQGPVASEPARTEPSESPVAAASTAPPPSGTCWSPGLIIAGLVFGRVVKLF
ncbi:MAG: glucose/sorbosone dehydrogenase [Acidobacteriota bacterium]